MKVFRSATTGDHEAAVLQHQTSHLPSHHRGRNEMWVCSECVGLFLGIHQCLHIPKRALETCCSAGRMQGGSGYTPGT